MKIWLNKLNSGDMFYKSDHLYQIHHYKVIGNAHNANFKMPRYKVVDVDTNQNTELFVNHYVYDNYDECKEQLLEALIKKLSEIKDNKNQPEDRIDKFEYKEMNKLIQSLKR